MSAFSSRSSSSSVSRSFHPGDGCDEGESLSPRFELTAVVHDLQEPILWMDCQHDVLALLGERGALVIRDTARDGPPLTTTVRNPYRVFVDPSGSHALVSTMDGEMHYYAPNRRASTRFLLQPRPPATQGSSHHVAESVCWLSSCTPALAHVLLGTRVGGLVVELRVEVADEQTRATCRLCAQLPPDSATAPIAGLAAEAVGERVVVLIATPTRLFRREGGATGAVALLDAETDAPTAREAPFPRAAEASGRLALFRSGFGAAARAYAWVGAAGIVHGLFHRRVGDGVREAEAALLAGEDASGVVNEQLLPLGEHAAQPLEESQRTATAAWRAALPTSVPLDVGLTAFHMVLLYRDRLIVLNHPAGLTWRGVASSQPGTGVSPREVEERVRFDTSRGGGVDGGAHTRKTRVLRGIVRDVASRKVYIFGDTLVWELIVEQEHRRQWRLFLDRALCPEVSLPLRKRFFDAAHQLCKYNPAAKRMVQLLRGKFFLRIGALRHATDILADCDCFEEVYDMLVASRNSEALRWYVEKRFRFLVRYANDPHAARTQLACLFELIVVQRLDHITRCEATAVDGGADAARGLTGIITQTLKDLPALFDDAAYDALLARLLEGQGRPELALFYAEKRGKLHYLLIYHVSRGVYGRAVEILAAYSRHPDALPCWYEFAPVLMKKCPISLTTAMLRTVARDANGIPYMLLQLERLIPIFIQYNPGMNEDPNNGEHQVIIFLEQCITRFDCVSTVVHNYYLSLLAQHDGERLEEFIESSLFYNVDFALRRCLEARRYRQCVGLYRRLRLYEDAIRTALDCAASEGHKNMNSSTETNGVKQWPGLQIAKDLLKSIADSVEPAVLKKLWMLVAQYVVERNSTRAALDVVEDSGGVLKLEDILGHISDSTVVQNFKDAICKGLDAYTTSIADLQDRQVEASRISEDLKREIAQLPHRFGYVTTRQRCMLCRLPLLHGVAPYLIYQNCRHAVHEACAIAKVEEIGGLEAFFADEGLPRQFLEGVTSTSDLARVECVLCGEASILEIDIPFYTEDHTWSLS